MSTVVDILLKELNNIYFPNGMPLLPEDKKKEIIEHIEKRFEDIEEALKKEVSEDANQSVGKR